MVGRRKIGCVGQTGNVVKPEIKSLTHPLSVLLDPPYPSTEAASAKSPINCWIWRPSFCRVGQIRFMRFRFEAVCQSVTKNDLKQISFANADPPSRIRERRPMVGRRKIGCVGQTGKRG